MTTKTEHQIRVEEFLTGIGREIPTEPQLADRAALRTWGMLLLEEVFEWLSAAGLYVFMNSKQLRVNYKDLTVAVDNYAKPDLVKIVDAAADISVVNTGGMSLCGVCDVSILETVDANNLLKVQTGHMDTATGKFIKAKDHPKPDFEGALKEQGMK